MDKVTVKKIAITVSVLVLPFSLIGLGAYLLFKKIKKDLTKQV